MGHHNCEVRHQREPATAEIDGKKVDRLEQYRVQTPMYTFGPLPNPPIFTPGPTPGATGLSVDAGTYILLEPMSVGHHKIHFTAYNGGIDTTYIVTVEP